MSLTPADIQLYYRLFFPVLAFCNRQLKIVPDASDSSDITRLGAERVVPIRDALYAQPDLLDQYVAQNPDGFTPDELAIVASWKHRISGDMYLLRYLRPYAVFMPEQGTPHLYGVNHLIDPFDVMLQGQPLPVFLLTVLLPFRGQIICDGLISVYSIMLGPGIRGNLNTIYRRLKQNEGIIEQLVGPDGSPQLGASPRPRARPAPDWKPALAAIVAQTEAMQRGGRPVQTAALGVLREAARLAQLSYENSSIDLYDIKPVQRAMKRLQTVLNDNLYG